MTTDLKPFGYPVDSIWDAELLEVPEHARRLLEEYSSIAPTELMVHINKVVTHIPAQYPYPCLGHYRFLDIQTVRSPAYSEILTRLTQGETLLDLGCCIGQELRQLTFSDAPSSSLYGADICAEFFNIGYNLFRDRDTFSATFLQADLFEPTSALTMLAGKIDMIWTASVIHLWDWEKQQAALPVMFRILDTAPAPLLAGRFMGFSEPGDYIFESKGKEESFYRHNDISFRKLFTEASQGYEGWELEVEAPTWEET
ncbi:hypothetical protein BU23DRAFT_524983 [Bimuria novae-zelandiae CBS 107.79]|uniref:Methyltransferase domain-containing protein n=1 Tax=Bimuria novae-zelandiae CBS 107.79 TaxID=1447943 RepID=A0A6A5VZ16_9PLEO|nr:hypothetical protein BU23DRAFT_524983 [Bimuria novae-zelandiae CBS 107.79]